MAPHTYGEILARNIRAARARADLGQENVAARMRALGFDGWVRQTVGSTEKPTRRVTAEEIFGLSLVLQTSPAALMAAAAEDGVVDLPNGTQIDVRAVYRLAYGLNDGVVRWEGDDPVFIEPPADSAAAWPPGDMTPRAARRIRELEQQLADRQQDEG